MSCPSLLKPRSDAGATGGTVFDPLDRWPCALPSMHGHVFFENKTVAPFVSSFIHGPTTPTSEEKLSVEFPIVCIMFLIQGILSQITRPVNDGMDNRSLENNSR